MKGFFSSSKAAQVATRNVVPPFVERRVSIAAIAFFILLALPAVRLHAQSNVYSEHSVKAAFIYNFFKFIEFPHAPSGDVRLCVLASSEHLHALRSVDGKALAKGVLHIQEIKGDPRAFEYSACDALFFGASHRRLIPDLLASDLVRNIISIGEDPTFLDAGGAINFYVEEGKVRFEVHLQQAESTGAKISSKLLKLGRVVSRPAATGTES